MAGLASIFGDPKPAAIRVEPIGGEVRPATIIPSAVVAKLGSKETVIVVLLLTTIMLGALNIGMAMITSSRAISVPYVADGSPFGCRVEVPGR